MEKRHFAATGSEQRVPIEQVDTRNGNLLSSSDRRHPHFGIQVNYVLKELQGYASLRDPVSGIEVRLADHTDIIHAN